MPVAINGTQNRVLKNEKSALIRDKKCQCRFRFSRKIGASKCIVFFVAEGDKAILRYIDYFNGQDLRKYIRTSTLGNFRGSFPWEIIQKGINDGDNDKTNKILDNSIPTFLHIFANLLSD